MRGTKTTRTTGPGSSIRAKGAATLTRERRSRTRTLDRGNLALVTSHRNGLPVRVVRGPKLRSPFGPTAGYRYDGRYFVELFWPGAGKSGFGVGRYLLVRDAPPPPVWAVTSEIVDANAPPRVETTVQRIVRNTAVAQAVKQLHDYR